MSVRCKIPYDSGTFFITFTNTRWLPLFELTKGYDLVYKFFDELRKQGHYVNAYVIMPNHVHMIVSFTRTSKSINTIIGNGKRIMGYELVKRLEEKGHSDILNLMSKWVSPRDRKKGQKHEVFEPSFDWKYLDYDKILYQKLDYIHANPCNCTPALVSDSVMYPYSSAGFYIGEGLNRACWLSCRRSKFKEALKG